jgi:hypothetical protein
MNNPPTAVGGIWEQSMDGFSCRRDLNAIHQLPLVVFLLVVKALLSCRNQLNDHSLSRSFETQVQKE